MTVLCDHRRRTFRKQKREKERGSDYELESPHCTARVDRSACSTLPPAQMFTLTPPFGRLLRPLTPSPPLASCLRSTAITREKMRRDKRVFAVSVAVVEVERRQHHQRDAWISHGAETIRTRRSMYRAMSDKARARRHLSLLLFSFPMICYSEVCIYLILDECRCRRRLPPFLASAFFLCPSSSSSSSLSRPDITDRRSFVRPFG